MDGNEKQREVYIGLGSNMGDRDSNLQEAINLINNILGVQVKDLSSIYLTEPWGNENQDDFLNQVILIGTNLEASELLEALKKIEIKMGRQRTENWGPRIIDLDILLYGDDIVDFRDLKIPHPYAQQRLFVLIPLQEINPDIIFPDSGMGIREVLIRALEREDVKKIKRID
ncbi:2-amino-4-hydroxy-6- hydroxymethyldihydropteridine pyrophosphokinase [hydrocarbon metagenome]|uniref:2-amino-4-hydroxy-6-hydroxymethyldihydropteridine diphosphokinase n=1 Tax=hydrocarbon metagenome TaxID=938273 RepID=A0A0W8E9B9_9ZZZZ